MHRPLGRISFDDALRFQEDAIQHYRSTGQGLPVIFSLEHDPVVTCGRSTDSKNLLLSEDEYRSRGIALRKIDRGGDVTFHGPGQVVVYPIVALRDHGLRAGDFVRILEDAMVQTCAEFGVQAYRRERWPGCWTDEGKIGATGAAVKAGGITKHGLAFNVSVDLGYFDLIVPCGISDHPVVRLVDLVDGPVDQKRVEMGIVRRIAEGLGIEVRTPRPDRA